LIRWIIEAFFRERERVKGLRHIFYDIISMENLLCSWREFLRGKRKRKDVAEFSVNLLDNILTLRDELANKTYRHGGYQAFKISDPKPRDIHKALVRDRLVHHAICRTLYPYFDRQFIFDSYSCRLDKGTHRAMNRFKDFAGKVSHNNTRTCWVLKGDIRKFFASIDHEILKNILARHVADKDVLWLLAEVIDSFISPLPLPLPPASPCEAWRAGNPSRLAFARAKRALGQGEKGKIGLPLGNLTSQLLVNVYMNEFDQFVKRELRARYYIRYADDFVILHEDKLFLEKLIPQIAEFLEKRLKLSLHPDKVFIKTFASGVDFLGWVHFARHRVLRTATKWRMYRRLEKGYNINTINSYLGLLSHGNSYELIKAIFSEIPKG